VSSERVLVWLKYRFIGDAVLTTPLLHALAKRDKPYVLTAPYLRPLLEAEPIQCVDNLRVKGVGAFAKQLREVRSGRYDVAVIVNRSFRSALMAKLAGVPRRIGFPTEGRGSLLTDRVPYDPIGPEGASYARLGSPLGLEVPDHPPVLTLTDQERADGRTLLQGATVGFQPGATSKWRAIPTQHAATIVNALNEAGHRVAMFGGQAEREWCDALMPLLRERPVDLVGACSLRETMAALSGLAVYVSPDTGLVHTAVALGTPTVAMFSVAAGRKWGHHYAPHAVFDAPDADMQRMDVDAMVAAALERLQ